MREEGLLNKSVEQMNRLVVFTDASPNTNRIFHLNSEILKAHRIAKKKSHLYIMMGVLNFVAPTEDETPTIKDDIKAATKKLKLLCLVEQGIPRRQGLRRPEHQHPRLVPAHSRQGQQGQRNRSGPSRQEAAEEPCGTRFCHGWPGAHAWRHEQLH